MAIIHLSGTRLAPIKTKAPLNRRLMYAIGFIYIIAMHFYAPNLDGLGASLPFNSMTWLCLSVVFAIGIYQITLLQHVRYSKLTIGLFISCLIITLPLSYSPSPDLTSALPRFFGLWLGWLLFLILQQFSLSNAHKQRLLWFIIVAALIEALFGYAQFFLLGRGYFLSHNSSINQPYGIFQNSDAMSSFLITGLVLSGYLLARQQRKYGVKISRTTLLYITPLITVPIIVLLATQLSAIIALFSVLMLIPYIYRFSTRKRFIGWLTSLLVALGLSVTLASSSGSMVHISDTLPSETVALTVLPQTVDMFIEKPVTGYGFGRFESEYLLYTARQHQLNSNYPVATINATHPFNEVLFWGVEGGVLSVIGIILATLFLLFKIGSTRKGTRLAILALLMPIALHGQFGNPFSQSAIHWVTLIILIFWVDQRTAKYKNYAIGQVTLRAIQLSNFVLPIMLVSYMIFALHTNYLLVQFHLSYPKRLQILDQVIYPASFKSEVKWQKYSTQLRHGLVNKNIKQVNDYIEWSLSTIKQKPNIPLYKNLILAYLGTGEVSKAEQIRDEARYLFPLYDFSAIDIEPMYTTQDSVKNDRRIEIRRDG